MNIRGLVWESLRQGLLLNVIFFVLSARRLKKVAAQFRDSGGGERKRSPFVYNLR
jgi:hypothetical protein